MPNDGNTPVTGHSIDDIAKSLLVDPSKVNTRAKEGRGPGSDGVSASRPAPASPDAAATPPEPASFADGETDGKEPDASPSNSKDAREANDFSEDSSSSPLSDEDEADLGILGDPSGEEDDPEDTSPDLDGEDAEADETAQEHEDEPLRLTSEHDDAVVTVTVDGETQEIDLGTLKRQYSGEKAIQTRLQQATEARKVALEDYENGKRAVEAVLQNLGSALFTRTVPEPDANLRTSDPTQYLLQREAYDRETNALNQRIAELQQIMNNADAEKAKIEKAERVEASKRLHDILPALKDPAKGPKVREKIMQTAQHFGYTPEQVAKVTDPQLFHMAYWASIGLAAVRKSRTSKQKPAAPKVTPKAGVRNTSVTTQFHRQQKAAFEKAKKSGKPEDVALTMLQRPPRKKRG